MRKVQDCCDNTKCKLKKKQHCSTERCCKNCQVIIFLLYLNRQNQLSYVENKQMYVIYPIIVQKKIWMYI